MRRGYVEFSVLSLEFCCEAETGLKNKMYLFFNERKNITGISLLSHNYLIVFWKDDLLILFFFALSEQLDCENETYPLGD